MTCGESRFVFTVINALCNSLKTIKDAEVFFFPLYFLLLWLWRRVLQEDDVLPAQHSGFIKRRRGQSQVHLDDSWHNRRGGGEIYAWIIIVSGGSGAASSNLAATNSNLSANISLLLTSVRRIVIGDIPSSESLLTSPIASSNTHLFPIMNFLVGGFVSPDDISQLLI